MPEEKKEKKETMKEKAENINWSKLGKDVAHEAGVFVGEVCAVVVGLCIYSWLANRGKTTEAPQAS